MKTTVVVALLVAAPQPASAEPRWSVGLGVSTLGQPDGHLGIPIAGDHLAPAIYARRTLGATLAATADVGLATAEGLTLSVGAEARRVAWSRPTTALELVAGLSGQVGFAGPDYYARHGDIFVGYAYAAGGTPALGVRASLGVRLRFARDRFETSLSILDSLTRPIDPHGDAHVDDLFSVQAAFGVRL